MNKKIVAALSVALCVSVFAFTGCGNSEDSSATDPLADGVLSFGVEDTYVPMEYRDENNETVGFDIDLGNAIGEELGVEVNWVSTAWDGIFTGLNNKQYDAILSCTSLTEERSENFAMTDPYIANGIVIVSGSASDPAETAQDLEGKTVGVQIENTADYAAQSMIDNDGVNFTIKRFDSMLDCFAALEGQSIDYVLCDEPVAAFYTAQNPDKYSITSEPLSNEPIAITCRKDDTDFRDQLNETIQSLKDDGTMAELSEKWFGKDITGNISTELKTYE